MRKPAFVLLMLFSIYGTVVTAGNSEATVPVDHYKFTTISARYLAAYRVAAIQFFQLKSVGEINPIETDYQVEISEVSSNPNHVAITFARNTDRLSLQAGGGQITYEVDLKTFVVSKVYRNR